MNHELSQRIEQYKGFPWEDVLRKDMGKYSLEEVRESFENIKLYFDTVLGHSELGRLSEVYLQVLKNQLDSLFQFEVQLRTQFQNVSERQQWLKKVKEFEYHTWEALKAIIEYIRFIKPTDNEEDPKLKEEVTAAEQLVNAVTLKINQVSEFETKLKSEYEIIKKQRIQLTAAVTEISQNKEKYQKASEIAENWIETEGKATAATIQDKSEIFNNKADREHTGRVCGCGWLEALHLLLAQ